MVGTMIGDFEVVRELGRGGMGVVYEGRQSSPRRSVALKVLPAQLAATAQVAARFRGEANRMAALEGHPNIATVYVAGEVDGIAYFAMQLLTGGDLETRLLDQQYLPIEDAVKTAVQVAEALDFAHNRGVIHRDIKPANIMFDAEGTPVVTDFGIAKATEEIRMTMTGMSIGTPEFASPEQLKGNPIDGRSDIYSLGVTLYRMLCGVGPFGDATTPMAIAMKHLSQEPEPPRSMRADIPADLQRIILKCLAKEPSDRYLTAGQLADDLKNLDWTVEVNVSVTASSAAAAIVHIPVHSEPQPPSPIVRGGAMSRLALFAIIIGVVRDLLLMLKSYIGYVFVLTLDLVIWAML